MSFWLKKILTFGLMALPFCLLMLAAGFWLMSRPRRSALSRVIALAALGLLGIFSNPLLARAVMRPLETRHAAAPDLKPASTPPAALAACTYVIALGAGYGASAGRPATGELTFSATARITEAVRLLKFLPGVRLIVCGPDVGNGITHGSQLHRAAVSLEIPALRIDVLDQAPDTESEARQVSRRLGNEPAALVTSASHMPRAMSLFHHNGLTVFPCPTGYWTNDYDTFTVAQPAFDATALACSTAAIQECSGIIWNVVRGVSRD
ncbi:MAG: hypothetical protein RIQ93_2988 [Verrucomicrobiota bacterium]|jgi:uncharacterized SAM-binding protein YcdF (DUF218 family)